MIDFLQINLNWDHMTVCPNSFNKCAQIRNPLSFKRSFAPANWTIWKLQVGQHWFVRYLHIIINVMFIMKNVCFRTDGDIFYLSCYQLFFCVGNTQMSLVRLGWDSGVCRYSGQHINLPNVSKYHNGTWTLLHRNIVENRSNKFDSYG